MRRSRLALGFALGFVFILACVTMGRAVTFEFVNWDDSQTIVENPNLNPPTLAGLARCWTTPAAGLYVPLTYSIWWAAALLGGSPPSPWVYHALSVLAHGLASCAALLLLYRLSRDGGEVLPAMIGAALFAVHPLQVEAVAWASGFKDVLAGGLSILSLWQYVNFATSDESSRRRTVSFAVSLVAFAAALLAKPSAVVVPLLAVVIDVLIIGRPWRRVAAASFPFVVLAIVCGVVAAQVQRVEPDAAPWASVPFRLRPLVACDALTFYLSKLVAPVAMCVDYGRTPAVALASTRIWLEPLAAFALLGLVLIAIRKSQRTLAAGALIATAGLLPVLGLVRFQFQDKSTVADHYMYLPMLGVAILGAGAFRQFAHKRTLPATSVAALLIVGLAILSAWQCSTWRNSEALFRHALAVNPRSWSAYTNLSEAALAQHGAVEADAPQKARALASDAEQDARKALELNPKGFNALSNLGTALSFQGRDLEALDAFRQAAALRPEIADGHANLAATLGVLGRFAEARVECERALKLNPRHPQALRIRSLLDSVRPATAPSTR